MKRILITSTAVLSTLAAPALAGDLDTAYVEPAPVAVAPAPVQTTDWTGLSLGVQAGYGQFDMEDDAGDDVDGEGGLYGLRAGYDYDFGSYVLGGTLQYDKTEIDLDDAADVDAVLRAGGRAGVKLGAASLAYGTAGFARLYTEDGSGSIGDSNGYFAGVGAETMVTDNVSVGTEVVYQQFNDFDASDVEAEGTTANVFVNYRF